MSTGSERIVATRRKTERGCDDVGYLVDTDILVDVARGRRTAGEYLDSLDELPLAGKRTASTAFFHPHSNKSLRASASRSSAAAIFWSLVSLTGVIAPSNRPLASRKRL